MNFFKITSYCLFSPRLYKIYKDGPKEHLYEPNVLEKWGDKALTMANAVWYIGLYSSPIIFIYAMKRGITYDDAKYFSKMFGCIGCFVALFLIMRGIGRATNSKYMDFIRFTKIQPADNIELLKQIRKYDFDFRAWPVTFAKKNQGSSHWLPVSFAKSSANSDLPSYQRIPIQILAYLATYTFAIRLIYPGSLGLLYNLLWSALLQGRTSLVEDYNGKRAKIKTSDGNDIDTMFVDNREYLANGKTLVVCCEGNAGFYEIGIMTTPVKAGYSALSWNHPGFGGSTGLPYPEQERNAIDSVMQYCIEKLDFKPENIILFGWSIGGYPATWAAINYPDIKALVLDATFDDILPLAQNTMPSSWNLLVKEVIRSYFDLNIAEMLKDYRGPLKLIRRIDDEILCLRPGQLSTNRGNDLVLKVLQHRHPELANDDFVSSLQSLINMQENQRNNMSSTSIGLETKQSLKLIELYMKDHKSTHCTPLPEDEFILILQQLNRTIDN